MRRIWACRGAAGRWWRRRTWWTWGRPRWTCRCTSPHSPGSRWAWRHLGEGQFKKYLRNFKEIPRHLFGWYGVDLALLARILGNTTRWSPCHYNSTTPQRGLRALEGDSWIIFIFHPPWMKNKYLKTFITNPVAHLSGAVEHGDLGGEVGHAGGRLVLESEVT